jgi:(R,R)-butanediol dehydrogenase/meso-butanediol dehydrogenase/diacetyl reductase
LKAAVYHHPGQALAIENVTRPEPGASELVVKVHACGICGTDLHATHQPLESPDDGLVLGHEFVGTVEAVGEGVAGSWAVGDAVCALPFIACGSCDACQAGRPFECATQKIIGLDIPGGFAEYVVTGAAETLALPADLSFESAVLIEPLAVGLHAVLEADMSATDTVLVMGAGPIGLAVIVWCRYLGVKSITVVEKNPARAQIAKRLGATKLLSPDQDLAAGLAALQFNPTVVFECAGVPGLINKGIELAAPRGRVIVVGLFDGEDSFVPQLALVKQLRLIFAIAYTRDDFQHVIDALAAGRINPTPMITRVVGLDEMPAAFESLKRTDTDCKIVVLAT